MTGDLLGHFVVFKVPVVAGWFFPPHQSVINFVRATVHDFCSDVKWLASCRQNHEFPWCHVMEGNACLLGQAQVTLRVSGLVDV